MDIPYKLTLEEIEELKRLKSLKYKRERKTSVSSSNIETHQADQKPTVSDTQINRECGIVINRMYVGGYLESNLGHEIINLFQADNGHHYLYLNSSGSFAGKHRDVDSMLMVRYVGNDSFEVIGLARGLETIPGADKPSLRDIKQLNEEISCEQQKYILSQSEGGINYGGVSILDIFNDAEQQSVFITFRANEVYVPKGDMRIFLKYQKNAKNKFGPKETIIAVKQHNLPKTSLKSYIYQNIAHERISEISDYDNIMINLIENSDLWTTKREWKIQAGQMIREREISLFDICKIQNDENCFSNALAYFMTRQEYRSLWIDFFKLYDIELGEDYKIEREVSAKIEDKEKQHSLLPDGGRIDLLISDAENILVIENKIKSPINSVEQDLKNGTTQLDRYVNYINWKITKEDMGRIGHFFILCPDYNRPELKSNEHIYRIITYSELYSFLSDNPQVERDSNFKAFRDAMQRHTYSTPNGYLYNEMLEKFERRINKIRH